TSVVAVYDGDSVYSSSSSDALTQTVAANDTAISLSSSPSPSQYTQDVTFTVAVAPAGSALAGTPSGQVEFYGNGSYLGSGTLSGGVATLDATRRAAGHTSVVAVYDGDSVYSSSSSDALTQTVNANDTFVSVASSPNPSQSTQDVTFTATVTP